MFTFLVVITSFVFVLFLLVAAMRPAYSQLSLFELKRRASKAAAAQRELERQERLENIQTLLKIVTAVVFVAVILLLVVTFGWVIGSMLAVLVAIMYPSISRMKVCARPAAHLYSAAEPALLRFVAKTHKVFDALRDTPFYSPEQYRRFDSREELAELIENAKGILDDSERATIQAVLLFSDKKVSSVMTPRNVIDFIEKKEFLGPLVLSELATLGHSRLPVIDKDLNHVVGILHLRDLLSLDEKRSTTAEKAMDAKVYYIHQDDTLEHALAAFLRTRRHLFIVINDERETVGLMTLEDAIEALIGRRIVDEDDVHGDLRAVAQREGRHNNSASGHVDL